MQKGIRIGTIYTEIRYRYCADDNAHWPYDVDRPALACPLENAPARYNKFTESTDLFTLLFGA